MPRRHGNNMTPKPRFYDDCSSVSDYACYFYYKFSCALSGFFGTTRFHAKAKLFGLTVGKNVKCYGGVHILRAPGSTIVIGNDVNIVSSSWRSSASSLYAKVKFRTLSKTAKIIIGDNVSLNGTSIAARSRAIKIGSNTMIASDVMIVDSDCHSQWPPETRIADPAFETDADVEIGKYVWIGSRSILLKGVHVGDNSIVAAGSVVVKDIPSNVVAGGVPARILRQLP